MQDNILFNGTSCASTEEIIKSRQQNHISTNRNTYTDMKVKTIKNNKLIFCTITEKNGQ